MQGLRNKIGGGEKPIINLSPYNEQRIITLDELVVIQTTDNSELVELEKQGITVDDLTNFMDYLISAAFAHQPIIKVCAGQIVDVAWARLPIFEKLKRYATSKSLQKKVGEEDLTPGESIQLQRLCEDYYRNYVDNIFRVEMAREPSHYAGWNDFTCPYLSCANNVSKSGNRDVFFRGVAFMKHEYDTTTFPHLPLRLNDISVHLIREHGIWQKGVAEGINWDQCYPTSPKQFAQDFYIPWKNSLPKKHLE